MISSWPKIFSFKFLLSFFSKAFVSLLTSYIGIFVLSSIIFATCFLVITGKGFLTLFLTIILLNSFSNLYCSSLSLDASSKSCSCTALFFSWIIFFTLLFSSKVLSSLFLLSKEALTHTSSIISIDLSGFRIFWIYLLDNSII